MKKKKLFPAVVQVHLKDLSGNNTGNSNEPAIYSCRT